MTKKLAAEFVGTFALVLFGCGAAVLAGPQVGNLGIAAAFGLTLMAMCYAFGAVSGCHINPAVSFAAWIAGRLHTGHMLGYWVAQCLGAVVGAGVLLVIASGGPDYALATHGLGQNGYGVSPLPNEGSPGDYSLIACAVFEVIATFLFAAVVLGAQPPAAGLAVGVALAVVHIVGIQLTGVSVNPARSLGPAVWVLGDALAQLWLFIAAPMAGAGLAGCMFRVKLLSNEEA